MNKKVLIIVLFLFLIGVALFFVFSMKKEKLEIDELSQINSSYLGKKVLYINSYHRGFEWSDGEQKGVEDVLTKAGVMFKSVYMDTKNNPSTEFGEKAALLMVDEINNYKPDVLIVTDDAAYKYLISVYYKNLEIPVVFGGINWDLSSYGGQYLNTTGILEIAIYKDLVARLSEYSKGKRIGFLTGDNISEHKNAAFVKKNIDTNAKIVFVKDFKDWKNKFIEIQKDIDILIIGISAGIEGFDNEEAEKFVLLNTKVPTGVEQSWMMPFAMLGYTKNPQEQGETSANMALEILKGKTPRDIPIVENKKGDMFLNLKIADKLGILIDNELLKNATIID